MTYTGYYFESKAWKMSHRHLLDSLKGSFIWLYVFLNILKYDLQPNKPNSKGHYQGNAIKNLMWINA